MEVLGILLSFFFFPSLLLTSTRFLSLFERLAFGGLEVISGRGKGRANLGTWGLAITLHFPRAARGASPGDVLAANGGSGAGGGLLAPGGWGWWAGCGLHTAPRGGKGRKNPNHLATGEARPTFPELLIPGGRDCFPRAGGRWGRYHGKEPGKDGGGAAAPLPAC